jgi:deazaflavin-dependent oxidoreductase (nitroreductase family)
MPLSRRLAHFNRRVTNRITRHVAWWAPGFAIVTHVGRRSGRTYHTPVNVFRDGNRYTFALTYGRDADWVRNVLAAGGCEIRTRGRTVRLEQPELFTDQTRARVPAPVRVVLGAIDAQDFLALEVSDTGSKLSSA